jgi:hypothetical protein
MSGRIVEARDKAVKIQLLAENGLTIDEWFPKSQIKGGDINSLSQQQFEFNGWIIDDKNANLNITEVKLTTDNPTMQSSSTVQDIHPDTLPIIPKRPFYPKLSLDELEEQYHKESNGAVQGLICKLYMEEMKIAELDSIKEYIGNIANTLINIFKAGGNK